MNTILGLTGGTGCGKSTVAEYLQKKGAEIIDADEIARFVVTPGQPALAEIAAAFTDVLLSDGTLNRKKLGSLVFSDAAARSKLNEITHAYIINEIKIRLARTTCPLTVIDAPLLFECGLDSLCTACVGVLADVRARKERIMLRDGLTEEEALNRINAQPTDAFYRNRCRFIIENNNDSSLLEEKIDAILKELSL